MKTLSIEGTDNNINFIFDGLPSKKVMVDIMEEYMTGSDLTNKDFVDLFESTGHVYFTTDSMYAVSMYNTVIYNCFTGNIKEKVNYR